MPRGRGSPDSDIVLSGSRCRKHAASIHHCRRDKREGIRVIRSFIRQRVQAVCDQIVYASAAYVDLKSTTNAMADSMIDFSRQPRTTADHQIDRIAELIRPIAVPDDQLIRVGGDGDGGYVMVDGLRVDGAISIGVGPDVSWDRDVALRGIPVVMFDHTVRRLPAKVPGGVFHRIGVGVGDSLKPLSSLLEIAGFQESSNLLLNIDVEGAEWEVFQTADSELLARFQQVVCELHGFEAVDGGAGGDRIVSALERLSTTHVPVHLHANNYSRIIRFGDLWFPSAVEVSWVRRDLASDMEPRSGIRSMHDRPNDSRVSEIDLEGILRRSPA